jgi:hypothetical protein
MVNFYHEFIPRLADMAAPLNALRKKGANIFWGGQPQQQAFEALKQAISQLPILGLEDLAEKFILQTDASSIALTIKVVKICGLWFITNPPLSHTCQSATTKQYKDRPHFYESCKKTSQTSMASRFYVSASNNGLLYRVCHSHS